MKIGEIAKYRMDERFQNCFILFKFWFAKLKTF